MYAMYGVGWEGELVAQSAVTISAAAGENSDKEQKWAVDAYI